MAIDEAKEVIAEKLRKWEQLRRLVDDPEMAPFFEALAAAKNGHKSAEAIPVAKHYWQKGQTLIRTVLEVCNSFPGEFTIKDVLQSLESTGFQFGGADPQAGVGNCLRILASERKAISVVRDSSGRQPKVYRSMLRGTGGIPRSSAD